MPVKTSEMTDEEKQKEEEHLKRQRDAAGDKILKELGLDEDDEDQEDEDEPSTEEVKEGDDVDDGEDEDEEPKEDTKPDEDEEDEEDVVPVSTMKKRINAEKARNQVLEARISELEAKADKADGTSSRRSKLENMSEGELKALKQNAKSELRELIRSGDDPSRESQVDELIDEIDDVMKSAPDRFQKEQVRLYDKAVNDVMADPANEKVDFSDTDTLTKIKELAVHVYNKYPELKDMKTGQATALKMAVEHFREVGITKTTSSKTEKELKQKKKELKRKTALDEGTQKKGMPSKETIKKARKKARDSQNILEKEAFVESLLEVDKYLPEALRGQ